MTEQKKDQDTDKATEPDPRDLDETTRWERCTREVEAVLSKYKCRMIPQIMEKVLPVGDHGEGGFNVRCQIVIVTD